MRKVCLWTSLSNNNIVQILKLLHEKNCLNINLYQRPVTDIRGRIYNSIARGIIVSAMFILPPAQLINCNGDPSDQLQPPSRFLSVPPIHNQNDDRVEILAVNN